MLSVNLPDSKVQGLVFNIQRYSVHDGGGIRTVVFLKGCHLRCKWCSNPESQDFEPELARNEQRCIGADKCDFCAQICPNQAMGIPESGMPTIFRDKCLRCMSCANICPANALQPYGIKRTVKDVIDSVEQDALFYSRSGGGMTISGGEPLAQPKFALSLLREAKKRRIDTAIETCGHAAWGVFAEACSLLREILFDIKMMDHDKHRASTGVSNELILDNLKKIIKNFKELNICVRTPVIPGINDSEKDIGAILDFLAPYPQVRYELLGYHRLGTQKYSFLDREYPMDAMTMDSGRLEQLNALVAERRKSAGYNDA